MDKKFVFGTPRSEGVKNAIARARQLCELEWTPARECIVNDNAQWGFLVPARSGREQRFPLKYNGVPYSSTRVLDKFVGHDISPSTFVSATENPISIVYTRELSDVSDPAYNPRISNVHFAYGVVCNSLASYTMDLPLDYSTREWGEVPELYRVAENSIDDIALADTMVTYNKELGCTGGHLSVITDILRDGEGRVQRVEITEGWEPTQRARWDSRETFEARMLYSGGNHLVFRHKNVDSIRPPMELKRAPTDLMLDLGAFCAYKEGDSVQLHIAAAADALVIENESGACRRIEAKEFKTVEIDGVTYTVYEEKLPAAHYRAYLETAGQRSESVLFSVIRAPKPRLLRADGSALSRVAFTPVDPEGAPLTESSACLYKKGTEKLLKVAPYALSYNGKLYSAYGAVRKEEGRLFMYPTAPMTDEKGNPAPRFEIGAPVALYHAAVEEGEPLTVDFSGCLAGEAYSLCPKEEAAVTFDQRLFSDAEREAGRTPWKATPSRYNRFVGLSVVYKNEYGRVTSEPYFLIVL
jgi:hypothetical protein